MRIVTPAKAPTMRQSSGDDDAFSLRIGSPDTAPTAAMMLRSSPLQEAPLTRIRVWHCAARNRSINRAFAHSPTLASAAHSLYRSVRQWSLATIEDVVHP